MSAPLETISQPESATRRLEFVPAFDGVRAIAVLMVVATHVRQLAPDFYGTLIPKGGFVGVDVFFVLSGFLITALLLGEQGATLRIRLGSFYRRRALRLLPALAAFLGAHVIYATIVDISPGLERRSVLSVLFYVGNWKIVYGQGWPLISPGLAHLWSLSVEEQFYLVWPLLTMAWLSFSRRLSAVGGCIVASIVIIAVWRAVLVRQHPPGIVYFRTDARADALLVGALAAHIWVRRKVPRRGLATAAWLSVAVILTCALFVESSSSFLFDGGFTLVAVATAIVLLALLETDWSARRFLATAPLRGIGRVSYGIYLWHYAVFTAIADQAPDWSTAVRVAVALALTAAAVSTSWYLVEQPFLRRK